MTRLRWLLPLGLGMACVTPTREPTVGRAEELLTQSSARASRVALECTPPDAAVAVDEVPQGSCLDFAPPKGLKLGPGEHHLRVFAPGRAAQTLVVSPGGADAVLHVTLDSP